MSRLWQTQGKRENIYARQLQTTGQLFYPILERAR